MKRQTVGVLFLTVVIGVASMGLAVCAEESSYEEASNALFRVLGRLENVLLGTKWRDSAGDEDSMRFGVQGVVNSFEGPAGEHYDVATPLESVMPRYGPIFHDPIEDPLNALLPAVEAFGRLHVTQLLDGESRLEFLSAQRNFERFLNLAYAEVLLAFDAIPDPEAFTAHMDRAHALLVVARGNPDDRLMRPTLLSMTELLPMERYWVEEGESIQAAIDRASDGATILIGPGVYREALTIKKSIHLVGSADLGGTLLEPGNEYSSANAIDCFASGDPISVAITGLSLRGPGELTGVFDWGTGIYVWGEVELTLADVTIESFSNSGLVVGDSSRVHGSGLTFVDNGSAIILAGEAFCEVVGVSIDACVSGQSAVLLADTAHLSMRRSTISDSVGDGILYEPTATIELNEVQLLRNGGYGVRMKDAVCETDPDAPKLDYFTIQEMYHVGGEGNVSPGPDEDDGNTLGGFCPEILMILEYVSPY